MADVQVTVETPSENQIIAVEFDGREIIQPPLTHAEHFAKQAGRIDFNEINEFETDDDTDTIVEDEQEEDESTTGYTGKCELIVRANSISIFGSLTNDLANHINLTSSRMAMGKYSK